MLMKIIKKYKIVKIIIAFLRENDDNKIVSYFGRKEEG